MFEVERILKGVVFGLGLSLIAGFAFANDAGAVEDSELAVCLAEMNLAKISRVAKPDGTVVYGRVTAESDGRPTRIVEVAPGTATLAEVFDRAIKVDPDSAAAIENLDDAAICSPVALTQAMIDDESHVVLAVGLNYAAHAEEAGGGEIFLFPKPAAPTGAYHPVYPPSGTTLLDYEVELGFVLLEDLDLTEGVDEATLLDKVAFFLSNEISDREPIVLEKAVSGPGTGFVKGKGQPTFLPAGPWLVRGSDLWNARKACGAKGLGLRLWVDAGRGPELRQSSDTSLMILKSEEIVRELAAVVERDGLRSKMPVTFPGASERYYPLAVAGDPAKLSAGSILLTGTPDGVALGTPSISGLVIRGLLHLQSPQQQFVQEEKETMDAPDGGRYLKAGHRVIATIDGLGVQSISIEAAGRSVPSSPCNPL